MIRKFRKSAYYYVLIAVAIAVRSLIAPGYMLDPDSSDGFGWNIILCNGFNGIHAISGLEQKPDHSRHHGQHHDDRTQDHVNHDNHKEDHFSAACGIWSASASLITDSHTDSAFQLFNWGNDYSPEISGIVESQIFFNRHRARAPPVTLS